MPRRQHDVQPAFLSTDADIGAPLLQGQQQTISLVGVMAANPPQLTLQFAGSQQPLQRYLNGPARIQPLALDGVRQRVGHVMWCCDESNPQCRADRLREGAHQHGMGRKAGRQCRVVLSLLDELVVVLVLDRWRLPDGAVRT
jgi:hypothetical protein